MSDENTVFAIYKLWTDSMENLRSAALGYKVIGYVTTKERAEEIANSQFIIGDGWPIKKGERQAVFYYREIPQLV